ncbi:MAG: hypothetical protein QGG36_01990 [Pirellulaceae bacterium]|jgi:hypothetical protein|nr:hypothetical protein [Pirellulaceae bacterium]MDP7014550.1 hypothetical protein [Pirellulaceae bacterium]
MSIQIECGQCGELLSVPVDSAGKTARCPACQSLTPIPTAIDAQLADQPTETGVDRAASNPFSELARGGGTDPPRPASRSRRRRHGRLSAHRGEFLLCLGVVALLFNMCTCYFLGGYVWYCASDDLQAMRVGRMDSRGRGLTHAAMILGMVATAIHVGYVFLYFARIASEF